MFEPRFTLHAQRLAWCCGFAIFTILSILLAVKTRSTTAATRQAIDDGDLSAPHSPRTHKLLWILLPMGAAMQLSAVTSYITSNLAAIPQNTFTYIRDSAAQVQIVEGDARMSLARESPQHFDVLVIDAFSGDAIPIHLLTTEALALYRRHLTQKGILAFHISNRHVDLAPAISLLATSAGMQARCVSTNSIRQVDEYSSTWVLVTADPDFFAQPELSAVVRQPELEPGLKVWTDDYSALFPLIRW